MSLRHLILLLCCFFTFCVVYYLSSENGEPRVSQAQGLDLQADTILKVFKKRFPTAIIIGAKKCGTTALQKMLYCHPSIKVAANEVAFFSHSTRYQKGTDWYIKEYMPISRDDQLTIEKSPQYFESKGAPERLSKASKDVKIILVVRNPLVRAVSDFAFQNRRHGQGKAQSFSEKVFPHGKVDKKTSEIKVSMYDVLYREWTKWFLKEQILIVNGDNLKVNPTNELRVVEKFLHVPHFFEDEMITSSGSFTKKHFYFKMCENSTERKSASVGTQNQINTDLLSEEILKAVAAFLQPHAKEFCLMASVNFSWCTDIYLDSKRAFFLNN